jgi:uncharacterized protein (DUF2141 family)
MMKKISILLLILIQSMNVMSQSEEKFELTLNFEVTKHDKGQILFAIYNSAESHMQNELETISARVEDGKASITVSDLKKGYYSFSYFHDLDSNGELNTNFVGIPKEPYGFSNGERGRMGPPDFEDCKIMIDSNQQISIQIK